MRSRVALAVTTATPICGAILAGCGGSSLHLVPAQVARQRAAGVYSHWRYDATHFPPRRLRARPRLVESATDPSLARLARRFAFGVVSLRYLARDRAGSLIVQTSRSLSSFAVDVSAIERAVDPFWHGGLSYHVFFEARDGHGVPFIARNTRS
jgi:hypothetical protein